MKKLTNFTKKTQKLLSMEEDPELLIYFSKLKNSLIMIKVEMKWLIRKEPPNFPLILNLVVYLSEKYMKHSKNIIKISLDKFIGENFITNYK